MAQTKTTKVGDTFGLLTVAGVSVSYRAGRKVLCYCQCGNTTLVLMCNLGVKTHGCGCTRLEEARKAVTKHGGRKTPEYSIWSDMWKRCTNPKNSHYHLYKDRVPPESWKDFAVFMRNMGPRPSSTHTLDRVDNMRGYGPDNCRWATPIEQARNKASVRLYSNNGGPAKTLREAAEEVGVLEATIRHRLSTQGWLVTDALGPDWVMVQGVDYPQRSAKKGPCGEEGPTVQGRALTSEDAG